MTAAGRSSVVDECSECGHLHYLPELRTYDSCPVEACACPHAPREYELREAPRCPGCGLVMSNREAAEQGACNECSGGAWSP